MGFVPEGEILLLPQPLSVSELVQAGESAFGRLRLRQRSVTLNFSTPEPDATYAISEPVQVGEAEVQVWVTSTTAFVAVKGPDQNTRFGIDPEEGSGEIILRRPRNPQQSTTDDQQPSYDLLIAGTVSITSYPTSES